MKILQLRFKNLNSLSGEWFIDFTSPEYASDGIFAITGPTGSGKTTILDAICLALYGRTPRLTRVTKSGNEIMARQTGECFAEVTFETQSGRFRCHWSQHRARKKPDGDFQPPKHEIADAKSGEIIETKIRDVAAAIESRTGMDFDRFTRSMLLAQGGFAAFLQAAPDERGPILEQITGTELYSEISRRVHERHREEHGKLDLLKAELSGIQLLSAQEKQQLSDDLKEKQNTETELSQKNGQLNKAITWLDGMANLEKELESIEGELEAFQIKQKNFEPEQKKLQRANQAVLVDGEFAALSSLRNQQENDTKALFDAQNRQPEYEKALTESESARKNAETGLQTARENLKEEQEIIKKVRVLDFQIEEKTKAKKSSAKEIQELDKQIETIGKTKIKTEKKHHSAKSDLSSIDEYLSKHDVDSALVSDLTGIQQRLDNLRTAFDKKHQLHQALKAAKKQRDAQALAYLKSEKAASELQSRIKNSKDQTRHLSDAIEKRLDGHDIQHWRNTLERLKERSRVLEKVSDLLNTISTTQTKLLELQTTHTSLKQEKVKSGGEIKAASEKQKAQEREVGYIEKQVALMNRIRNLEAERAHLEDGKPCPLCGSENHPYAEGNIPAMDETESALKAAKKTLKALSKQLSALQVKQAKLDKDIEQADFRIKEQDLQLKEDNRLCLEHLQLLGIEPARDKAAENVRLDQVSTKERLDTIFTLITDVEKLENDLKSAREAFQKVQELFAQADKKLQQAKYKKSSAESELERITGENSEVSNQWEVTRKTVLSSLKPYGIEDVSESKIDNISKSLTNRLRRWQEKQGKKADLEKQLSALNSELEKHQLLIHKHSEDVKAKRVLHGDILKQLEFLTGQRNELYGKKNVDEEEKRLEGLIDNAEKTLSKARETHDKAKQALNNIAVRISSLIDGIDKRKDEINRAKQAFADSLTLLEFENEADYQAACLSKEERESLNQQAESLRNEQTELETCRKDRTSKLTVEREKKMTNQPGYKLKNELDAVTARLKDLGQDIVVIKHRLSENDKARETQQERIRAIEARTKESAEWDALHELIGSSDGKKYRNFAQGLTFEIMVSHANRQLQNLTDRYLLMRDERQPLELNVVDNYQAGVIRSTKNLSGGESFIVSLSLALGLSHMAGRNVRVDSLFLDEGFGTLDEEALETALETLAGLQQDGKLIGIISHVAALKERISTQIEVLPQTGGRSIISGPGCRQVTNGLEK